MALWRAEHHGARHGVLWAVAALMTFSCSSEGRAADTNDDMGEHSGDSSVRPTTEAEPSSTKPSPPTTPSPWRGDLELSGFLATPFEGHGAPLGFGWRMLMGVGHAPVPLTFGFDFQSVYFGDAVSRTTVGSGDLALTVDKARRDTALFFDAYVRLQPPNWPVRPYLEGIAGAKLLRTDYSVTIVGGTGSTEMVSDSAWAHTAGVGLGVDFRIGRAVALTGGVRFLAGGRASFSRPVGPNTDAVVRYDTTTSTTLFSIGLAGRFAAPPPEPE